VNYGELLRAYKQYLEGDDQGGDGLGAFRGKKEFSRDGLGSGMKSRKWQKAKSSCAQVEIQRNKEEHMVFTLTLQLCF
jgi:hypothetical protein